VPFDTGNLEGTGYTLPATIQTNVDGASVKAEIGYGGTAEVDYAEIVHDDMNQKTFHRPGAGPKFLSTHLEKHEESMGAAFEEAMGRGEKKALPPQ